MLPRDGHHLTRREAQATAEARLPRWALGERRASAGNSRSAGSPRPSAFVVRLGIRSRAADHHPDILVNYKRVTLTYMTHSAGGLTNKDFAGAAAAGKLAEDVGGA